MSTDRRGFLRAAGAALAASGLQQALGPRWAAAVEARRPNIVMLLADDLGWTDLGCFGSGYYETPQLDRLASQGMRFTDAYAPAGNCAPSRACLMTGQYIPRHGVYTVGDKRRFDTDRRVLKWSERKLLAPENDARLPSETVLLPQVLRSAGYATGHFGKWGLAQTEGQAPQSRGFDEAVICGGLDHYNFKAWPTPDPRPGPDDYLSDYLTDQALRFIDSHRDRPFCLDEPDFLVHSNFQAPKDLIAKYEAKQPVRGHHHPIYAAMVERLDHNFGRIVAKIDALGLAENTLILFTSDNGGVGSAKDSGLDPEGGITSNAPLRGMKGMLYEGGLRVPMIARWTGVIEPGSVCHEPVCSIDCLPTYAAAAGTRLPDQPVDGADLGPLFRPVADPWPERELHWWMPGYLPARQRPAHAMRLGDWKVIESFEDGRLELFNLRQDIGERTDLSTQEPARVASMHARMLVWRERTGAEPPPKNPDWDPRNEGKS